MSLGWILDSPNNNKTKQPQKTWGWNLDCIWLYVIRQCCRVSVNSLCSRSGVVVYKDGRQNPGECPCLPAACFLMLRGWHECDGCWISLGGSLHGLYDTSLERLPKIISKFSQVQLTFKSLHKTLLPYPEQRSPLLVCLKLKFIGFIFSNCKSSYNGSHLSIWVFPSKPCVGLGP